MVKRAAMTKYLLTGLLLTSAVPAAATAATSSSTDGRITAEGLIGYGVGFDSNNLYGFGFGARAGYSWPFQLYTGVSFQYYVGTSVGPVTINIWTLEADFGYERVVGPLELRSYLGIGIGDPKAAAGGQSISTVYFALMPGGVAIYNFNGPFNVGPYVGVDIHFTWLVSAGGGNGISFLATGGYRF